MADTKVETNEVTNQETNLQVTVVEKEGFMKKVGSGVKKVVTSKPFKIIGGIVAAIGIGGGGYLLGKASGMPDYGEDYGPSEDDNFDEVVDVDYTSSEE